ncbi:MAG TPA: MFS transporter [Chloroflexi bacterium]|nr:MFS transporter [Chloroflexota bacterium]
MEGGMRSRYRWFVVFVFFLFMLLHQTDKLLIGPLTTPIMEEFGINEAQMGAVSSVAILVSAVLYLVWGYLYDRYARAKLVALASLIWGSTTWLNALAPNYPLFLATRATTGIDDSSYPGIFSLLSDYFSPRMRGKVYGLLQIAQPMGYMLGTVLALTVGVSLGWRRLFFITGGVGLVIAVLIFFGVREMPRGRAEPEMEGLEEIGAYRIDREKVRALLNNPTLLFLMAQGFFGVFPWNVITFWFFRYLETERGYSSDQVMVTMLLAILFLSAGYFVGGYLGDFAFRRTRRGRALVSGLGVLTGAVLLYLTLSVPVERTGVFMALLSATGLTMSIAAPNVPAIIHDIIEPEARSTAHSMTYFAENIGSAAAPFLAGLIAVRYSLHLAILSICVTAWLICTVLFGVVAYRVPRDVEGLRRLMQERARQAEAAQHP